MIKINKAFGYLIGLILTFILYFIGQLFFFINTEKVKGHICEIAAKRGGLRYRGNTDIFYACFITKDNISVKVRAGSNLQYDNGDTIMVIYKKNNPDKARLSNFYELWVAPSFIYILAFALIMGIITAAYYQSKYVVISRNPFKIWVES